MPRYVAVSVIVTVVLLLHSLAVSSESPSPKGLKLEKDTSRGCPIRCEFKSKRCSPSSADLHNFVTQSSPLLHSGLDEMLRIETYCFANECKQYDPACFPHVYGRRQSDTVCHADLEFLDRYMWKFYAESDFNRCSQAFIDAYTQEQACFNQTSPDGNPDAPLKCFKAVHLRVGSVLETEPCPAAMYIRRNKDLLDLCTNIRDEQPCSAETSCVWVKPRAPPPRRLAGAAVGVESGGAVEASGGTPKAESVKKKKNENGSAVRDAEASEAEAEGQGDGGNEGGDPQPFCGVAPGLLLANHAQLLGSKEALATHSTMQGAIATCGEFDGDKYGCTDACVEVLKVTEAP